MHISETRKSELFNTLAWMGLLSTEEYRIREVRNAPFDRYIDLDLTNDDIERVGYYYPHVAMKLEYKGLTELWFGDMYLNPEELTWIETNHLLYAVMNQKLDVLQPVKCFVNPNILYRYSKIVDDEANYTHVVDIDTTDIRYATNDHIEHAAYYISQNKVCVPTTEWIDEKTLRFRAPYQHDIDFFICSNIVNVVEIEANKGILVDNLYSNKCYHRIFVDYDPTYPIDARFYPYITTDKNCVIRIFNDSSHTVLYPDVCRLMLYDEYLTIDDPYNTDNEYLNNLPPIDVMIKTSDSDAQVMFKFGQIAKYFYKLWEKYPIDSSEQSDFIICDNTRLTDKAFVKTIVHLYDEEIEKIMSLVPVEQHRDLIFYNGQLFSDYTTRTIKKDAAGNYNENLDGQKVYLIDSSYDLNGFTLIKFNTNEDTNIMNIGEYIDMKNIAHLHRKINRFYRNLMVIRMQFMDDYEPEQVRIATVQPNATDNYLWFELLVNAVPEMFETRAIDMIDIFGLDSENIPQEIKEGAYMIDMDPEDGPASYTELLMTYFKLSKNHKQYLALQFGDGVDDPRIKVFHNFKVGKVPTAEDLNAMYIESENPDPAYQEDSISTGYRDHPVSGSFNDGDIYVQNMGEIVIPPGKENVDIDKISMGPNTPEEDEHTLWIDADASAVSNLPVADSLDGVTESMFVANEADHIEDAESGDYAMDALLDDLSPEEEGEIDVDDLLTGLDESSEIDASAPTEDLLGSIGEVLANNTMVDDIDNPEIGMLAMDDVTFMNSETGESITMDEINAMSTDEKLSIARRYITDDDTPTDANIGDMWIHYLSTSSNEVLNTIVYKILLTAYVLGIDNPETGDLALEGDNLPETEETVAIGEYESSVKRNQMLIHPIMDDQGNEIPDYEAVKEKAVTYIMSVREPVNVQQDDLWLGIPAAVQQEIIKDVISRSLMEIGAEMPEGFYLDDGHDVYASMGFDYHAHDKGTDGLGDLFREKIDDSLHPIYYGDEINGADLREDDIWYEFLDTIDNRVAYSDPNTMVIRVDERLVMLKFDRSDIQAFAFDDIMINFNGKLGVKYLSIIADLLDSGELKLDDVNLFYKRLITFGDDYDPHLKRLYTGTSHVVTTTKIDTTDCSILYSTNIGRFRMDYSNPSTTNKERDAAYRMCIDYSNRDFAFLNRRMLVFVNGKYIPTSDYTEDFAGKIQLTNFHEIIATVDILYSKKDIFLMNLKKLAYQYQQCEDYSKMIDRPSNYGIMEPIQVYDRTKKGYYDILLDEYILSGKLQRILNYLEDHQDEAEEFKNDLIRKFHAIADTDLSMMPFSDSRIIITGNSYEEDTPYQVGTN